MIKKDKIFFTDSDIEMAESISILDVAQRLGLHLVKQGSVYSTKEHDSLKIFPISNTYYRFSTGESGNTINFVRSFSNLDFIDAMKFLIGEIEKNKISKNFGQLDQKEKNIEEKEKFYLPKLNNNIKRIYSYLINTRKISKEVISEFIKNKSIREDINHNVLFIGFDEKQNPRYCALSGTLSEVKYKGEVKNSDKRYSFKFENKNSNKVIIFESPIDLLSAKTILKSKGKDNEYSYLSLGGLSSLALENFLENHKNVDTIISMLDNDIVGKKAFDKINEKFKSYKIMDMSFQYQEYKDVNDWLRLNELKNIHFKSFKDNSNTEKELISDNIFDLKEYRNEIEKEIFYDENKFVDFLKVMGNNHKQSYNNQLFIFVMNPTAIACTTKDIWKNSFNRNVLKTAKEIEILKGDSYEIIYDIEDTKLIEGEEDKFYYWGKVKERNFLNINRFLKNNSLTLKSNQNIDDKFKIIVNNYLEKNNLKYDVDKEKFLYETLKISSLSKLKQNYLINKKLIKNGLEKFNYKDKLDLINTVHNFNKEFLEEIKLLEIEKNLKKVLTNEKNSSIIKEKEENLIGGNEYASQSSIRRRGGRLSRDKEYDRQIQQRGRSRDFGNDNFGENKKRAEMSRDNSNKQKYSVREDKISSISRQFREISNGSGYVLRGDTDGLSNKDSGIGGRLLQHSDRESHKILAKGIDRRENRNNEKRGEDSSSILGERKIHRNDSNRGNGDENVRLRLENIQQVNEDDNLRSSSKNIQKIDVDNSNFISNIDNKDDLQADSRNKEFNNGLDNLEVDNRSTSFNLEKNKSDDISQRSFFDNHNPEIDQMMDRYNVPREAAENLLRGKEDLKNLGYKPNKERLSFARNYDLKNHIYSEYLTPSEKLDKNIKAIKMLKRLENENRSPREYEQAYLADYLGWGGVYDVFDEERGGQWEIARNFLKENLSKEEYLKAMESTLTAFYTPKIVIDSMYKVIKNLGFENGNILEPSSGIGNFIGNIPSSMKNSKFYAVELDSISGRICKLLYPESDITIKGFEKTNFSNNFFDLAIGNVPFGNFKVSDRKYDKNNFLIHDYFFAKSIDNVRNGGIIAFITSSGTMDKKDESVRKYINARCEFLGALRLPNDTFKKVAGTDVTSDIIFLKKRDSIIEIDDDWIHLSTDKNGLTYNKYFVDNSKMVLGNMKEVSGRFGNTLSCISNENLTLEEQLSKAILNINGSIDKVVDKSIDNLENSNLTIPAIEDVKNFSYTLVDDKIFYREDSIMTEYKLKDSDKEKIKSYLKLSKKLKEVIELQKGDFEEEKIIKSRDELNNIYDNFFEKYNFLNSKQNRRLLNLDSNYPLVSSIEILKNGDFEKKADIFFKRTIKKPTIVEKVKTPKEALILSIKEKGFVDLDFMNSLLDDMDKNSIVNELNGDIFLDIKTFDQEKNLFPFREKENEKSFAFNYVTADEYLSGNIRKKLSVLNEYIDSYSEALSLMSNKEVETISDIKNELSKFEFQKKKLQEVMPKKLTASEINVRLGTTWIPKKYYQDFIFETLKTPYWAKSNIEISYSPFKCEYHIDGKSIDYNNDIAEMTFGTKRANAYKLIENALNLRQTKVFDRITENGEEKSVLNKKETLLATQKQELLNEEFKNWIYKDFKRREFLENIYNEKFNSIVNREYNGKELNLLGINSSIELKEHQKNAIARVLFGGNTLLAHVVGAGKTFEMVASAMESKRLGMCTKSLFVVPNHLTEQIGREFMLLYPGANILVSTKKDFEPQNRKRFIGRIATGEYDAVIIGHTQFEKIPMSKEYQENYLKEEIDKILDYISKYKNNREEKFTIKDLKKTEKNLRTKLEKLTDDFRKDDVVTFEELGIDKLFVDEAHSFKNLYLYTKMKNVAGISQTEALKSSDMFMKCRYMDKITNNKAIVFATGTPISNSMTELYTMQRYLQYDELKKRNLENFDAWASTFGETQTSLELSPEGTGYRMKTRFSKFHGLPELMAMFKEVADIKTSDMLHLEVPKANFKTILIKPTEEQKEILKTLVKRADLVRNSSIDASVDNMLKITNDGKKLALDQRLINEFLPDDENSKVNICVNNVFSIWEKTEQEKSTQIIFCDMSTPKDDDSFNIYDDIKSKLIQKGIPEDEIAFIHDAKNEKGKEEIFSKVREGVIRVFFGSTAKCGAGTNIQNKLIALHDLDVPWRPSDLEQRSGRIIRQGNKNKEVSIYRYVTENTFDSYLWQTIENKQRFISQIMTSKTPVRSCEDVDEVTLNYSEIKALATGNPLIKEKMDLDNEITRLKMAQANFKSNKFYLEDKILNIYPNKIRSCEEDILAIKNDISNLELKSKAEENFNYIDFNGKIISNKKLAAEKLLQEIKKVRVGEEKIIAKYRNFNLKVAYNFITNTHNFSLIGKLSHSGEFGKDAVGNITRMDNVLDNLENKLKRFENELIETKEKLEIAKAEVVKPFEKEKELKIKIERLAELNILLNFDDSKDTLKTTELEDTILSIYNKINSLSEDNFDNIFKDKENVKLKYLVNGKDITFSYDLINFKSKIFVDGKIIKEKEYIFDESDISSSTPEEQIKNDILMIDKENGKSYEVEKFLEKSENIAIAPNIEKGLCF